MSHDPNAPIEVEMVDGSKFTLPSLNEMEAQERQAESEFAEAFSMLKRMGWGIPALEDES